MFRQERLRSTSRYTLGLISLLVIATWKCGTPFFWRDDWLFLIRFMERDLGFLFESHAGHFLPLFKFVYLVQLYLLGVNVEFFHLVGLMLYALICASFLLFLRSVIDDTSLALFFAVLLALHPVNFIVLLWLFQIDILLLLFFQISAMRIALRDGGQNGFLVLLLLVAQALSFGNGHLFPLAVSAGLLLLHGSRSSARHMAALACLLSLILLCGQYFLMRKFGTVEINSLLAGWARYPAGLLSFVSLTLTRAALVPDSMVSKGVARIVAVALFSLGILFSLKDRSLARRLALALVWLFTTSAIVPFARADSAEAVYYYNTLSVIPGILYIALLAAECYRRLALGLGPGQIRMGSIGAMTLLLAVALFDQRLVDIFERRNARNQQAFAAAMTSGEPYRPFDDPVFAGGSGLQIAPEEAVKAYRYWAKHAVLPDLNRY